MKSPMASQFSEGVMARARGAGADIRSAVAQAYDVVVDDLPLVVSIGEAVSMIAVTMHDVVLRAPTDAAGHRAD